MKVTVIQSCLSVTARVPAGQLKERVPLSHTHTLRTTQAPSLILTPLLHNVFPKGTVAQFACQVYVYSDTLKPWLCRSLGE